MIHEKIEAIIVAAGKSKRIGRDKLYIPLKKKPVIFWTIEAILPIVPSIILVIREEKCDWWNENNKFGIKKIIIGGGKRQDSVFAGLKNLSPETEFVLIHDGARPFVKRDLIIDVIKAAKEYQAAAPGIKSTSSVKVVNKHWVINTLNRDHVWLIQTPQCFKREIITLSYERAYNEGFYGIDCANVVERAGFKIKMIPGDERNIKITTPFDLELANFLVK